MPMQATTTAPLFSAALRPDRSPGVVGGWVALVVATVLASPLVLFVPEMLLPASAAFVAGVVSMSLLSVQQSHRRRMRQQVTLWPDQLEIATSQKKGERVLKRFDPKTVRLILDRDDNEKVLALRLRSGKEEFELGAFLTPQDKSSFAKAFGTALRKARQEA
ncbi:Uncharacterized membrane protein [Devosia sp. YR412]|uniref:DUF2244 domain-containing protein n=1 Tax=Devosia sp. YR412 TaxID=1881030 RepID=UPI0008AC46EC|nr:DUF2244 domain-containing protein [Devosia sp. YR412]SEQ22599.1 Uncharacterized membrane protein [Devosia sp. YR412]